MTQRILEDAGPSTARAQLKDSGFVFTGFGIRVLELVFKGPSVKCFARLHH